MSKTVFVIHGIHVLSVQLLEVPLLGVEFVLRLDRNA